MKKFLAAIAFGLMAIAAQAEATFDQIEGLIQQHNYSAAAAGLEVIISNHPKSAKAFYAMAQAQAGLGNLEKAQKALNIATGLNPTLDFAPASSVASLKQAITPQTAKIEVIEESHALRNFALFLLVVAGGYFVYAVYARKKEEEARDAEREAETRAEMDRRAADSKRQWQEMVAKQEAERKEAEEKLKAHKNYGNERFDPTNPDVLLPKKTKAQIKAEADAIALREAEARAEAAEREARASNLRATYNIGGSPAPATTVVHTSSNDGLLTGMIIGNMMSGSHHDHHDTTIIRETVREVPASRSSWDDDSSTPSKPSSWDDGSSSRSSSSSSWDSSSSSSSSSSWDSSSSSSDSGSSSSWD